jgi:hypothetical protein
MLSFRCADFLEKRFLLAASLLGARSTYRNRSLSVKHSALFPFSFLVKQT